MDENERFVGAKQIAEMLGVKISWIYEKARKNGFVTPMPSRRVGKYLRFMPSAVMNWLDQTQGLQRKETIRQ